MNITQGPAKAIAIALVIGLPSSAHAQGVADFYRGKTLNMVIGYPTGGSNDLKRLYLLSIAAARRTLDIASMFRTVAQQYLLYRWFAQGRCGISAAATPGRSNHESGRALESATVKSAPAAAEPEAPIDGTTPPVPGQPWPKGSSA